MSRQCVTKLQHSPLWNTHAKTAWNFDTSVIAVLENDSCNMILCNLSYVENIEARRHRNLYKMYVMEERLQWCNLFIGFKIKLSYFTHSYENFNFKTILYIDQKYMRYFMHYYLETSYVLLHVEFNRFLAFVPFKRYHLDGLTVIRNSIAIFMIYKTHEIMYDNHEDVKEMWSKMRHRCSAINSMGARYARSTYVFSLCVWCLEKTEIYWAFGWWLFVIEPASFLRERNPRCCDRDHCFVFGGPSSRKVLL